MISKLKYILFVILFAVTLDVAAQNSQVMYYMNLPQNHLLNPALKPSNTFYLGLPVISGINVNVKNNFFNLSDVLKNVPTDTGTTVITCFHPDYDPAEFMKKIKDVNSLETEGLVQLFGLGFGVGRDLYISLDVNERVDGNIALPGDILRLGFEGNEQFIGKTIDLSSLRGDIKYYREASLGFSKNFTEHLRIGFRAKTLFGIAAASIDNRSLGITVNDDYTHSFNADLSAHISAPVSFRLTGKNTIDTVIFDTGRFEKVNSEGDTITDINAIVDYFLETKNLGLGIDIGAEYKITDRLKVSAAVTDLGYIKWKKDVSNLKAKGDFIFSGIDMLEVYNGTMTFDSLGTILLDSLKNSFTLEDTKSAFTTYLPVGVTLGGSYNLTNNFSVGLLSYTRFVGSQIREALTVSANLNIRNVFSTTIAYTAMNHRYDNLGFGLAFKPGWFQFYVLADRIPLTWNKILYDDKTLPLPTSWNTVHIRLGMNLAFGNRVEKKNDKPMVMVQENPVPAKKKK